MTLKPTRFPPTEIQVRLEKPAMRFGLALTIGCVSENHVWIAEVQDNGDLLFVPHPQGEITKPTMYLDERLALALRQELNQQQLGGDTVDHLKNHLGDAIATRDRVMGWVETYLKPQVLYPAQIGHTEGGPHD